MKDAPDLTQHGVNVVQVDYHDQASLTKHLQGVHTVLSFIVTAADPESREQKNLIDASVDAGVKRFAPSEWATYVGCGLVGAMIRLNADRQSHSGVSGYKGKDAVHAYLQEINRDTTVRYRTSSISVILTLTGAGVQPFSARAVLELPQLPLFFHQAHAYLWSSVGSAQSPCHHPG